MTIRTKEEAAGVAASWWVEKVTRPKFDAGSDTPAMMMAGVMALSMAQKVEESEQDKFKNILKQKILNKLEKTNYQVGIHTDYGPEGILAEAMNEAEIPSTNAPWKTSMWIDLDGTVSVKYGYGRGVTVL